MTKPLTLLVVHAHPDDEAITTGGVLARYADEGIHTVLVTCTRGEEGEIVVPEWDTEENHRRLAELREVEMQQAVEILKIGRFYQLGYRDSGMVGNLANQHPACFHMADTEQAVARMVEIIRRERPEVVITYDEEGGYGHPDHIKAHLVTLEAFAAAGEPERFPEAGEPWRPLKLYYPMFRRSSLLRIWEVMHERGMDTPLKDPNFDRTRYVDDERLSTEVDIYAYTDQKLSALQAHRTQIDNEWLFFTVPDDLRQELLGREIFVLVESHVGRPEQGLMEVDLFAGIR